MLLTLSSLEGNSVGCYVALEISRQLAHVGCRVEGLLLIDMPCPSPQRISKNQILAETVVNDAVLARVFGGSRQLTTFNSRYDHMRQLLTAMNTYSPASMTEVEKPAKTTIFWAERGLVNRMSDDPAQLSWLRQHGIPTEVKQDFMDDATLKLVLTSVP